MEIKIKYNIDDVVFFVKSSSGAIGDFKIHYGIVDAFYINYLRDSNEVIYTIIEKQSKSKIKLKENLIFKDAKDIYNFFDSNIRTFLDPNTLKKDFKEEKNKYEDKCNGEECEEDNNLFLNNRNWSELIDQLSKNGSYAK